ncbi:MAG: 4-aminobutyrate--2-oxoglutarate transaminase [Gammaproteobacteria bacterium]
MTDNESLHRRRERAIARGLPSVLPIYIERAENAELWDVEGKRYIDFGGGIAVLNTGHLHPRIKAAAQAQLDRFSHTCFMVTPYESAVAIAEKLNSIVPGPSDKKTMLVSTGAEAVENAVKIARAHTGRPGLIAFGGGFHGRTLMALALTGMAGVYKQGFGPFAADVYHAPFPIAYHGVSVDDSLAALDALFRDVVDPASIAAIVIEPVLGEGGFYPAPPEFLRALRSICDEHGIVMVVDEIQTGFGRTGRMFALEYAGVEADIMTLAKGIAGGFPLAALVGRAGIMDAPAPGGLGGTYAGSPIACAAALAAIDVIEQERLADRAVAIGQRIRDRLLSMAERYDCIGEVRALGAMLAIELVEGGDAARPDAELAQAIVRDAADRGLVILRCGLRGNVIRFLVALTASDEIIDEGLDIVDRCLEGLAGASRHAKRTSNE